MAAPNRPYPDDVIALAALTLVQQTLRHLLRSGKLIPKDINEIITNGTAIHLQSPAGESKQNRLIAGLLREIGDDLSRPG